MPSKWTAGQKKAEEIHGLKKNQQEGWIENFTYTSSIRNSDIQENFIPWKWFIIFVNITVLITWSLYARESYSLWFWESRELNSYLVAYLIMPISASTPLDFLHTGYCFNNSMPKSRRSSASKHKTKLSLNGTYEWEGARYPGHVFVLRANFRLSQIFVL